MISELVNQLVAEFSGKRTLNDIRKLWQFRVTVFGPALRASAQYCAQRMREVGVRNVKIEAYNADDETLYGTHRLRLEWQPRSASLSIVSPKEHARLITTFADEPLSLASYSHGTRRGGVDAEVVIVEDGTKPEDYEGLDVKGKIVMTSAYAAQVEAEAAKRGAIGIITDSITRTYMAQHPPMREAVDAPDAVHWNCLSGRRNSPKMFAFCLSPRQGLRLRHLIRTSAEPVIVHAEVDARVVAGKSELVHALLKGKERPREEIWVLAHISEPGARDNASGLATSIEVARTLLTLISMGVLPPLKRSIRFMFATEVSGFLPYIHRVRDKLHNVLAGLTLDSVGLDLMRFGSELVFYRAPEYAASCTDDLMESLIEIVARMPVQLFGDENYACFPYHMEPFWGNDSFIADPYFDIPSPQISTWPDRFYHTSMDRPEQMSDSTTKRIGVIAAAYLYFLANCGAREARWLANRSAAFSRGRIARAFEDAVTSLIQTPPSDARAATAKILRTATLQSTMAKDAVSRAERFAPRSTPLKKTVVRLQKEIEEFTESQRDSALRALRELGVKTAPVSRLKVTPPQASHAKKLVPRRREWRIPAAEFLDEKTKTRLELFNEQWGFFSIKLRKAWAWADGRKSLLEIWRVIDGEDSNLLDAMIKYFEIYRDGGWVEM